MTDGDASGEAAELVRDRGAEPAGAVRVAGTSTIWWGTVLLLVVLSSMLSTLLFAHPYLGIGADVWGPETPPPAGFAVAAAVLAVVSLPAAMALHRAAGRGHGGAVAGWAVATGVLGAGLVAAIVGDLVTAGISATDDAYGSTRVVTLVFHLAVAVASLLVLLGLPLRLWTAELDGRQRGAAVCAALLWYYVVGGWLVVSAVVHLVPVLS